MTEKKNFATDYLSVISFTGLDNAKSYLSKCEPKHIDVKDEVHEVHTACRACIANCGVIATVKNGQVVKLKGDPVDPMSKGRMCGKGLSGINALYHPNRNKYPLVRDGEELPGMRR